ncbi:ASC domain containing protein [Asbolus verrucosus]|uniref:ASC domain containing protein n=1 Tax=Asbolus verrucosus TaxID=1661398 RepID=A0A482V1F9_ASBVE|nr:ASC domain containing protein [Asbolus verrucosus]
MPIYNIPFPVLTICPEAISTQDKFNYTKLMQKKEDKLLLTPSDVVDEVKLEFHLRNCIYMTESKNCSSMFIPVITDEGVCYPFNMLDRYEIFRENVIHHKDYHRFPNTINWSLEGGYTEGAGVNAYPDRAYLTGATKGFSFNILTPNGDLDFACKDAFQGYRVLLHAPMTMPRPSQKYFRIPLDQSVVGAI